MIDHDHSFIHSFKRFVYRVSDHVAEVSNCPAHSCNGSRSVAVTFVCPPQPLLLSPPPLESDDVAHKRPIKSAPSRPLTAENQLQRWHRVAPCMRPSASCSSLEVKLSSILPASHCLFLCCRRQLVIFTNFLTLSFVVVALFYFLLVILFVLSVT